MPRRIPKYSCIPPHSGILPARASLRLQIRSRAKSATIPEPSHPGSCGYLGRPRNQRRKHCDENRTRPLRATHWRLADEHLLGRPGTRPPVSRPTASRRSIRLTMLVLIDQALFRLPITRGLLFLEIFALARSGRHRILTSPVVLNM